jgi:hypothetical protein
MATPTNLPAAFTVGQVATAAQMNDLRGAFRVLQVITDFTTTQVNITSATPVDTNLTATITPQSTSSKILVYVSQGFGTQTADTVSLRIMRGATTVDTFGHVNYSAANFILNYGSFISFDSPATTSATIYKTMVFRTSGSGTNYVNFNDGNGIQRSTIVLMEISA